MLSEATAFYIDSCMLLYFLADKCGSRKEHSSPSVRHASFKQRSKITKPSTVGRKNYIKTNKKQLTGNKSCEEFEAGGKDQQLPIFQRVGRLLYPKSELLFSLNMIS
jgi:hypothetical protein